MIWPLAGFGMLSRPFVKLIPDRIRDIDDLACGCG